MKEGEGVGPEGPGVVLLGWQQEGEEEAVEGEGSPLGDRLVGSGREVYIPRLMLSWIPMYQFLLRKEISSISSCKKFYQEDKGTSVNGNKNFYYIYGVAYYISVS